MRNFSCINFNYTYIFHFLRVTRIHFGKIGFTHKYKCQESWSNKNHPPQVPSLHNTLESRIIGGVGIKEGGLDIGLDIVIIINIRGGWTGLKK